MKRNRVGLIGHVGNDPEIKTFPDGSKLATCSLATTEKYKDRNGQQQESTEWHRLVFRGNSVPIVERYVQKGKQIAVEGKITYRKYQDKDGADRYLTEIQCFSMLLLGGGGDSSSSAAQPQQRQQPQQQTQQPPTSGPVDDGQDEDDDLPF